MKNVYAIALLFGLALLLGLLKELSARYRHKAVLHVILDNYAVHSGKRVRAWLEAQRRPDLRLQFLPPYALLTLRCVDCATRSCLDRVIRAADARRWCETRLRETLGGRRYLAAVPLRLVEAERDPPGSAGEQRVRQGQLLALHADARWRRRFLDGLAPALGEPLRLQVVEHVPGQQPAVGGAPG